MQLIAFGYIFVVIALFSYALHSGVLLFLSPRRRAERNCGMTLGDLPRVTVQIPVYNERYVVERVIHAGDSKSKSWTIRETRFGAFGSRPLARERGPAQR